jgi:ketosteroid isomerase-like protein
MSSAPEHPNAALLRRLFEAFGRRDGAAVATMFERDVVWRVGGRNPMTGVYRGWREVVRFLRRTTEETDGTYRSELRWALGDDGRGVAVYRAHGRRNGRELDIDQVLLCEFRDGRICHVTALPFDTPAFDAFWSD